MSGTDLIYLDNNATTRIDPTVLEAMREAHELAYANPGSRHAAGRKARQTLEDSREQIAEILGAHPTEVIFTSGGTESINMALWGLAYSPEGLILSAPGEHPATSAAIQKMLDQGWTSAEFPIDEEGLIVTERLSDLAWNHARLATVILAHNETGVIQTLDPIIDLCEDNRVPLHIDAVQAVGKIDVNFRKLNVTALSLTAHKFHGPRGIGALLLKSKCQLKPLLVGGFQESERRAGTESVPLIAGMAKALELWHSQKAERSKKLTEMQHQFESGLKQALPNIVISGSAGDRLPSTSNVSFTGLDGEALLISLDLAGIACSTGSACASGSSEPSPILLAMKTPKSVYESAIRFSFSCQNTPEEIETAIARIVEIVEPQLPPSE
ncbi:Cysteine desulfurase [Polystyrenella longa]|uniref:Cysteine desulfurase n=1 Tax=Polystyrenella longa TaxID=2528007 RepID=A0A518CUK6_9PLAN|nr:cysteine desulfurase family protein [Polystyrenella longa]QDU82906.1 Cysteine desulfurase [Polystyrenella longa]